MEVVSRGFSFGWIRAANTEDFPDPETGPKMESLDFGLMLISLSL